MQNLYDIISKEDKECITQWINSYANCFPGDIDKILQKWSDNKKKLFKALGKNLRISYPITVKKDEKIFYRELTKIYRPLPADIDLSYPGYYQGYYQDLIEENHPFIKDLYAFLSKKYVTESNTITRSEIKHNLRSFSKLLSYTYIQSNTYTDFDLVFYNDNHKTKTIKRNARAIRAIQGVLKFLNYDKMENFNKWRNSLSDLNNARYLNCNVVFSIHPLDFMTMSDNTCNWSSCMAWRTGSHSAGTIEMMNSNNAIVVYLESPKPFIWNDHQIPNKTWRCLLYVHKDILCLGKPYPYYHKELSFEVLKIAQQFLKENLNWKYQYQYQKYGDLKSFYGNEDIRFNAQAHRQRSHKILLYTYGMYADLVEDKESVYWCCRNWVKDDLKICVSGRATCMNCGEYLDEDICDPDFAQTSRKYCVECEKELCQTCKNVNFKEKHYKILLYKPYISFDALRRYPPSTVCKECFDNDIFYDKNNHFFVHTNDINMYERKIKSSDKENAPLWIHAVEMIGSKEVVQC